MVLVVEMKILIIPILKLLWNWVLLFTPVAESLTMFSFNLDMFETCAA